MSQQSLIDAAKAPIIAYGKKDWDAVRAALLPGFLYDEVATHTGPLQTPTGQMAATGKPIEMRACQVFEIAGGKAQSMRQYFDMATLMQQLGVTA